MPRHQLRLIVGSRNAVLIFLGEGQQWIEAERIALDGKRVRIKRGEGGESWRLLPPSETVVADLKLMFSSATNSAGSGGGLQSSHQRPGCRSTCSLEKNGALRAWKVWTKALYNDVAGNV